MPKHRLAAALIALSCAAPAAADHWRQTADPQVVQALEQLVQVYGGFCQQGNQQACQMAQTVQGYGIAMLNAGYDCQMQGNQQACAYYQNAYGMLSQTYAETARAMGQFGGMQPGQGGQPPQYGVPQGQWGMPQPGAGGVNPLGQTHEERMQAIQNWGNDRTQWHQNRMQQMDRSHEAFMNTLRN
jgi:hypothetical protein